MRQAKGIFNEKEISDFVNYDRKTGIFTWKRTTGNTVSGHIAGTTSKKGYVCITIKNKTYLAHRLAWAICTGGDISGVVIDHIDGNKSNNEISNLRIGNQGQNCQNRKSGNKNNTSGYIGVFLDKRRGSWSAQITKNRKVKSFTGFKTPEEASEAYLNAKRELHEFCTI